MLASLISHGDTYTWETGTQRCRCPYDVFWCALQVVKYLLAHGAKPKLKAKGNRRALDFARDETCRYFIKRKLKLVKKQKGMNKKQPPPEEKAAEESTADGRDASAGSDSKVAQETQHAPSSPREKNAQHAPTVVAASAPGPTTDAPVPSLKRKASASLQRDTVEDTGPTTSPEEEVATDDVNASRPTKRPRTGGADAAEAGQPSSGSAE